jgi:hypothetical protein
MKIKGVSKADSSTGAFPCRRWFYPALSANPRVNNNYSPV